MPQWLASSLSEARKPNRARAPVSGRRRRQESPILREERDISRKAIAQGMSDRLRCPVRSCAISFYPFAHGTAGAARIRHSLLPHYFEGQRNAKLGRSRRENADVYLLVEKRDALSACPLPYTRTRIPPPSASGFPRCLR